MSCRKILSIFVLLQDIFDTLHDTRTNGLDLHLNLVRFELLPDLVSSSLPPAAKMDVEDLVRTHVRVMFAVSVNENDMGTSSPIQVPPPKDRKGRKDRNENKKKRKKVWSFYAGDYRNRYEGAYAASLVHNYDRYFESVQPSDLRSVAAAADEDEDEDGVEKEKWARRLRLYFAQEATYLLELKEDRCRNERQPGDLRIVTHDGDENEVHVLHDFIEFDICKVPTDTMLQTMFLQYFVIKVLTLHTQVGLRRSDVHAANYDIHRKLEMLKDVFFFPTEVAALQKEDASITVHDPLTDLRLADLV